MYNIIKFIKPYIYRFITYTIKKFITNMDFIFCVRITQLQYERQWNSLKLVSSILNLIGIFECGLIRIICFTKILFPIWALSSFEIGKFKKIKYFCFEFSKKSCSRFKIDGQVLKLKLLHTLFWHRIVEVLNSVFR